MQMGLRASHLDTTDSVGVTHAVEVGKREAGGGGLRGMLGRPPTPERQVSRGDPGGTGRWSKPAHVSLACGGWTNRQKGTPVCRV